MVKQLPPCLKTKDWACTALFGLGLSNVKRLVMGLPGLLSSCSRH